MTFYQEYWFKTLADSLELIIIVTFTIFHISRLYYNDTKLSDHIDDTNVTQCGTFKKYRKWVTTRTASFIAIFSGIMSRSIIYIYVMMNYNNLLNNKTCKWIIVAYMELGGIQKLGRDLFVLLRSKVTNNKLIQIPNRTLWDAIVCKRRHACFLCYKFPITFLFVTKGLVLGRNRWIMDDICFNCSVLG